MGKQWQTWFSWAPKSLQMVTAAIKLKDAYSLGKKAMTNLDSMLKSRDITLLTKVQMVKAVVFPVVMYRCESWTIKKAEYWIIDTFKLLCRREPSGLQEKIKPVNPKGNQPWILIGRTDAEAEAPILQPTNVKSWLTGKVSDAGKDWGQEEKREKKLRWLDAITDSTDVRLNKLQGIVKDREDWHAAVHGVAKSWTWLRNWTTTGKIGLSWLSVVKNLPVSAGNTDLIPGLGRFPWRRKWQPTPVCLPGKSHGQGSPAGSKS